MLVSAPSAASPSDERESLNAIVGMLNSRAAASPDAYSRYCETVAKDAAGGKPLQKFLIALASKDRDAPPAAKIGSEKREEYFASSRPKLRALAEKKSNSLALYLLAVDTDDFAMLEKAARLGNIQALNTWGTMLLAKADQNALGDTNTTARLVREARDAFAKAAAKGDANGLYNLGCCLMRGDGSGESDARLALEYFRKAAAQDHPEAINNIGGFYRDGIIVERNAAKACEMFARSADLGNAYGELNYALALLRGEGVSPDPERAVRLFRKSAIKGNAEAMNAYGACLHSGNGCTANPEDAAMWFREAAARGLPAAMENYAACIEDGHAACGNDMMLALEWKMRAKAARGDANAAAWLKSRE